MNLNSPRNTLIKLAPGRDPEEVPNGTNPDGVLLSSSSKIAPFAYNPTATEGEAFDALKMLFFNNISCEKESRYLLLSWLIYIFFLDFNKTKGLLKCTGAAASGKTTAASLLSTIIYGEDFVGQSSVASSISEGARDPIVFQDNVENKDLHRGLINFLLTGANTGPRTKRKAGSDTETVTEKIKALIIVTAIEPFPGHLPELISRTYEVIFDSKFHSPGFVEDDALRGLVKKRNVIISGLLKLVSKSILPKISGRSAWLAVLQKEFPGGHNKSRTNEFLSTLMIIVEEVLKHIPYYEVGHPLHGEGGDATALLKNWVMSQNALASEIGTSSNNILNLLDNFMRVVEADMNKRTESELPLAYHRAWPPEEGHPDGRMVHSYFHPVYLLEVTKTKVEDVVGIIDDEGTKGTVRRKFYQFDMTMAALHDIFNKYSRETGTRNPFDNATALGCRLANDIKFIQKGGWSLIGKEGELHLKRIQGKKIYRFRKEVIFS